MTSLRTPRTVQRAAIAAGAVLVLLGTAGCTASVEPEPSNSENAVVIEMASPGPTPSAAESTAAEDEVTCAAYGDVLTILSNAQIGFFEDRMGKTEKDGWFAIASRVLGNIPSAESGPVADALATLKEDVPAVPDIDKTNFISPNVAVPGAPLGEACREAGFEVSVHGFTGG